MVGGLDLHRGQITFELADQVSSEIWRGRIGQPDRVRLRQWLTVDVSERAAGRPVALVVEGCTGWRYVVEEIREAGFEAHVAEPAQVQAWRTKRRAKTDRTDARLLRELLEDGRLPLSWIPPELVLEWRERVRLYKTLLDQRTAWTQRIHAELYQHGIALPEGEIRTVETRTQLLEDPTVRLSSAARQRVRVGYQMMEDTDRELMPVRAQLGRFASAQPACRALVKGHYGVGPLTSVAIWSELGDCRRFSRSDQVVRHSGLDVTVHSSDSKRSAGQLSRQGPGTLRWALYEAGKCGARATSPDYEYYRAVRERQGGKRAALSVARKILRRCYHTLRSLDSSEVYAVPTLRGA
ncbi:MAG: IS110 family transposase [Actinobacteria bacterium]|nr:IS110 family transposase [Actinomycetota bacterium]